MLRAIISARRSGFLRFGLVFASDGMSITEFIIPRNRSQRETYAFGMHIGGLAVQ